MTTHLFIPRPDELRGLLDGRQTMVRRPMNPQPSELQGKYDGLHGQDALGKWWFCKDGEPLGPWCCPFGQPGDLFELIEVLEVRVERLQDITPQAIFDSGEFEFSPEVWAPLGDGLGLGPQKFVLAYANQWDIHYADTFPWVSNPWVWAAKVLLISDT